MLQNRMKISHLIVQAQQEEETMVTRKSRDARRARYFDGGSSKGRLDIHDKPKFKKKSYNKFPSNFPRLVLKGCLTRNVKR